MFKLRMNSGKPLHPAVPELCDQMLKGEIDRRQFMRTALLLGVSAASAQALLGGLGFVNPARAADMPKKGGTLRFECGVMEMTDPALVSWIEPSNIFRNSLEYLTLVDEDNLTHPYLAESWTPSDDLKVWHFKLRQNIKWSNGDQFNADDVEFNIKRWIDPNSKSSNRSSFGAIKEFEKVGPFEFALHLDKPVLAIPENLYAYTCAIVHRDFDKQGGNWLKNPVGTGPYTLTEYTVAQKAVLKRRDGYWGEPPLLDEIQYLDMGPDMSAHIAALTAGQVDILYRITPAEIDIVQKLPNVTFLKGNAAHTLCIRMQVTQKPFDDPRVRKAMVLAADNQKMLDLAFRGFGTVAENHHVAPFQPEYFKLPPVARDVAQAKKLLADAGYKDGLDVELAVGNTQGNWEQNTAQVLQQNVAEAGIRIKLNVMPAAEFWKVWDKVPFGVTYWAHRPLAVMTLNLAYRSGADWNESKYASKEFDEALDVATGIPDPKKRAVAMEKVEKILQDAAVMVQPYWPNKFTAISSKVRDFKLHPADYFKMDRVWIA